MSEATQSSSMRRCYVLGAGNSPKEGEEGKGLIDASLGIVCDYYSLSFE
jgi:hypothetical protein